MDALLKGEDVIFQSLSLEEGICARDPFWNLAAEDFLLHHVNDEMIKRAQDKDSRIGSALFLYNSPDPSIVLGRNQNTFLETSIQRPASAVKDLAEKIPRVVRRKSGGGCVYHDAGCLCFSFIGSKDRYNPRANLQIIDQAVQAAFRKVLNDSYQRRGTTLPRSIELETPILTAIGPRHDIFLNHKKITGSAMRMLQFASYHHGTVLTSSVLENVRKYLTPMHAHNNAINVSTRATSSVRSDVTTLKNEICSIDPHAGCDSLMEIVVDAICHHFRATKDISRNSNIQLLNIQAEKSFEFSTGLDEIDKIASTIDSWDWIFGENPDFTVQLPSDTAVDSLTVSGKHTKVKLSALGLKKIEIGVKRGRIRTFLLESFVICSVHELPIRLIEGKMRGCRFRRDEIISRCLEFDHQNAAHFDLANPSELCACGVKFDIIGLGELLCDALSL